MSFFSRSSGHSQYRNADYGSRHYQKKGMLGNLLGMFGSGSRSGRWMGGDQGPYRERGTQNDPASSQDGITCKKCGAKIPAGSKFCLECGEKVQSGLFCPNCGEKLPPDAKFCLKCGNKINA